MNKLDIIIPVHNESEIIVNLLLQFEKQINCNYKVIICYDFDDDSTPKVINQSLLDKSKIHIIKNKSVGPNEAIKTGIDYSNAEIILVYMADDFLNISLIDKMILKIDEGCDLIIPSRFIKGGTFENKNLFKKIITVLGYSAMYYIAGIPYRDCTNAFKMFSSKIVKKIIFNSSKGFTYALELTIKTHHSKYKIIEMPAKWEDLKGRKSKFKVIKWLPYYIYWLLYAILLRIRIITY